MSDDEGEGTATLVWSDEEEPNDPNDLFATPYRAWLLLDEGTIDLGPYATGNDIDDTSTRVRWNRGPSLHLVGDPHRDIARLLVREPAVDATVRPRTIPLLLVRVVGSHLSLASGCGYPRPHVCGSVEECSGRVLAVDVPGVGFTANTPCTEALDAVRTALADVYMARMGELSAARNFHRTPEMTPRTDAAHLPGLTPEGATCAMPDAAVTNRAIARATAAERAQFVRRNAGGSSRREGTRPFDAEHLAWSSGCRDAEGSFLLLGRGSSFVTLTRVTRTGFATLERSENSAHLLGEDSWTLVDLTGDGVPEILDPYHGRVLSPSWASVRSLGADLRVLNLVRSEADGAWGLFTGAAVYRPAPGAQDLVAVTQGYEPVLARVARAEAMEPRQRELEEAIARVPPEAPAGTALCQDAGKLQWAEGVAAVLRAAAFPEERARELSRAPLGLGQCP